MQDGQSTDGRSRVLGADTRDQGYEPDRLHLNQPQTVIGRIGTESLGSQTWSKPFLKTIGPLVPSDVALQRAEADRQWHEWWSVAYVLDRLKEYFEPLILDVVLALVRDREHILLLCRRFRRSEGWIKRQAGEVVGFVRQHFLPYSTPKPNVRSARAEKRLAMMAS